MSDLDKVLGEKMLNINSASLLLRRVEGRVAVGNKFRELAF